MSPRGEMRGPPGLSVHRRRQTEIRKLLALVDSEYTDPDGTPRPLPPEAAVVFNRSMWELDWNARKIRELTEERNDDDESGRRGR